MDEKKLTDKEHIIVMKTNSLCAGRAAQAKAFALLFVLKAFSVRHAV